MSLVVCIRGGGDLGSGVILRLQRAGMRVVVCELAQPLVVRRKVAFAEAVYTGEISVEEAVGQKAANLREVENAWAAGKVPVLIDPDLNLANQLFPDILVDARLLKRPLKMDLEKKPYIIGLGPGFMVGENCHAGVETKRGPNLGRVYRQGSGEPDSGIPEMVNGYVEERVLRAPVDGIFAARATIGEVVKKGQLLADVSGIPVTAVFDGVVRGLLHSGLAVTRGDKLGDLDPRMDPSLAVLVSDKALAVGGGVLEAILAQPDLRQKYCG